ncbi:TIGR01212 family radical SAM protein [Tichowtungia aerotolerans]|uniref:TIGR01212 family radical SAM protein n=1 Tax=Tichowtungia aerotolerans TaxID=2697043 RepID=A0A6P1M8K1_9BACT|nr:TIGR01212 family radical SAM protein [Tichowtungia aerotolerans]QHI70362.1 TIGR01212 family radical SAM protein [Tichowtungia aerotolerans]
MTSFVQYKPWMIERYGEPLFRIPVEIAGSCPHGRCAFCAENGSRAQQTQRQDSPLEQAEEAIRFARRRYRAKKFMLYIQAFTADLTDPDQQSILFQCLKKFEFEAVSIGTRPDCLPAEALEFLDTLKKQTEVWVELGVQTANDDTLKRILRGHDWGCSKQAILKLAGHNIHVAVHVILGLPGEISKDWKNTADELAKLPISGIKIHNLHVMKGTQLAEQYAATPFPLLNHWEYAEGLMDFLRRIPAEIPVMRITTDTPDDQLIAPHWHLEKGQFLDYVIQQMTCRQISQGDLLKAERTESRISATPVITEDGSVTFFSEDWKEHYHTKTGARLEAGQKFVAPARLKEKIKTQDIRLLDVCFGLGNNSLAAFCATAKTAEHQLEITALEMDKRVVRAAAEHFQTLETDPVDWKTVLSGLLQQSSFSSHHSSISLHWGDARWLIQALKDHSFDIIFHDPFSSQHCPELWTVDFFKQLHRVIKPNGVLLTYSSAAPVRGAMRKAGFLIAETEPGHNMGNGTVASPTQAELSGFSMIERNHERRAIPYRDPYLCATSKAILRQRQETVEARTK